MKILTGWTRVVTVGFAVAALSGSVARTQKNGPPQLPSATQAQDPFGQDSKAKLDPAIGVSTEKLATMRNVERQKRLVSDTERLLTLATQLHEDVEKTDQHILSVDVVKRAEEIEKLARSVKERMKG
jgi:hypothetical protein